MIVSDNNIMVNQMTVTAAIIEKVLNSTGVDLATTEFPPSGGSVRL